MRSPLCAPLPLALVILLLLVPGAAAAQERTVSVEGTATQQVPNDTASLGFQVAKERGSRAAALRVVSVRLRAVIAAVKETEGVGPGDVKTGRISIRKVPRGKRILYRASEGISVTLHQPDQAGAMVTAAVAAGATGTSGPRFFAGDPEQAYESTLLAAFDQAKAKAAALATRAGATLGAAISILEGTEAIPQQPEASGPQAVSAPAAKAAPTKPGASTVTATVHVVFELK